MKILKNRDEKNTSFLWFCKGETPNEFEKNTNESKAIICKYLTL